MLMQPQMILSQYADIYDKIIPKNNMLRRIKEMVNFLFIYDELVSTYSVSIKNDTHKEHMEYQESFHDIKSKLILPIS